MPEIQLRASCFQAQDITTAAPLRLRVVSSFQKRSVLVECVKWVPLWTLTISESVWGGRTDVMERPGLEYHSTGEVPWVVNQCWYVSLSEIKSEKGDLEWWDVLSSPLCYEHCLNLRSGELRSE